MLFEPYFEVSVARVANDYAAPPTSSSRVKLFASVKGF